MRMIQVFARSALAVGLTLGGAQVAVASSAATATQSRTQGADPSRRVCRMIQPTGSRLAIRRCQTQAEWDAEGDQSREAMQRQARGNDVVQPGTGIGGPR